jgi:hypothetical protein
MSWKLAFLAGLATLSLLLPGCLDDHTRVIGPLPIERLTPLGGANYSGLAGSLRVVVRDPVDFAELWKRAWPERPVPSVDFATRTVLAVAMGERATGGYSIEVAAVTAENGRLVALVRSIAPGPGCAVTMALTQPVDFVSVPARAVTVRFDERHAATSCP